MTLKEINFSTGPVALPEEVLKSFGERPISHRSTEFRSLLDKTTKLLRESFRVKDAYILSGSGTLANEVMLQQIKMRNLKGVILSNGEFGERLVKQANAIGLNFIIYQQVRGKEFDLSKMSSSLETDEIKWVLFCHCETSTGVINDLGKILSICKQKKIGCYVDCISTAGIFPINLSGVSMATASSGKGLCGIGGLGIVFSNMAPLSDKSIPTYLDLDHYARMEGIPFTISSNLLRALYAGGGFKLETEYYKKTTLFCAEIKNLLSHFDLIPFRNFHVFTLASSSISSSCIEEKLSSLSILSSGTSEYLKRNNWLQLALMGVYSESEFFLGLNRIKSVLNEMHSPRKRLPVTINEEVWT
jgi:hypothetical protein